jgi:hypothetical protein
MKNTNIKKEFQSKELLNFWFVIFECRVTADSLSMISLYVVVSSATLLTDNEGYLYYIISSCAEVISSDSHYVNIHLHVVSENCYV